MLAHRSELAVAWSDRAIEEAERWDAKPVRALAMVEKGSALAGWVGHRDEALATIREAIAEAEAVGDHVAVAAGCTTCSSASRCTPGRGKRSSRRSTRLQSAQVTTR